MNRNTLEIKSHGYLENENEKKLAFEREDAMRLKLEEALAANKEMGDALERIANCLGSTGSASEIAEIVERIKLRLLNSKESKFGVYQDASEKDFE